MTSMKKTNYLHNLIAIANSDGGICDREMQYLKKKATSLGFDEVDLERMLQNASEFELVPPSSYFTKIKYLNDCVDMAMADGKVSAKEMEMCRKICIRIGLDVIHLHEAITLKKVLVPERDKSN